MKKELSDNTGIHIDSLQKLVDSLSGAQRKDKSQHTLLNWIEQRPIKAKGAPKAYFLTDEGKNFLCRINETLR